MDSKIKKTIILVIIICLALAMSQTALAESAFRTTAGVHLRSSASTTSTSLMVVSANSSVDVLEHNPAGWSKVQVGSTTGFIRSDFLRVPTSGGSATFRATAGVHFRSSPSTRASSLSVVSANASVEVLEHDPAGWSKVKIGETTGYIRSDFLRYASAGSSSGSSSSGGGDSTPATGDPIATMKTIGGVNLRSGASTSSSVIRTLPTGTTVDVMANEASGWSQVRHNGTNGYIRTDLLTSGELGTTQTKRTIGTVNLRASASTTSSILRTLSRDTAVEVISTENNWSRVTHNGTNGFIRADLLTTSSASTPSTTQTMKTIGTVNLRASASTSSSILRTLTRDTAVEVISTENGWSRVTHNGTNGFIKAELLTSGTTNQEQAIATVKTTGNGINVRSGPSTSATLLRTLSKDTSVDILGYEGSWSRVRVGSTIGYIRSDLLPSNANVELLSWADGRKLIPLRTDMRVVDVRTGIAFNVRALSTGGTHADVETSTREDTEAFLRTRNGVMSWSARPIWLTVGNRTFATSMHGMPHDISTIRDNGMDGHLCLWFKDSTAISASYTRDMQNAVMEAWDKRPR